MVQMKGTYPLRGQLIGLDFISHMVQMKETMKLYELDNHKLLYIPHGSDESFQHYLSKDRIFPLYPTWFR